MTGGDAQNDKGDAQNDKGDAQNDKGDAQNDRRGIICHSEERSDEESLSESEATKNLFQNVKR